jgi:DNA repair protein RadC
MLLTVVAMAAVPVHGPRERLVSVGPEALSSEELVAILLGTGSRYEPVTSLASRVVRSAGGVLGLARCRTGELLRITGLGPSKASRVVAAIELGRRATAKPLERGAAIKSSHDVDRALGPKLRKAETEHFLAIPLDTKNRPMGEIRVASGGISACPVLPSDVFRALVREAAAGVVFVHNHPSGEPSPSPEDVALTERLERAGQLLGIRVVDHVILADDGYFSFLDAGLLAPEGKQR